jgi:hypothetical protein
MMVRAAFARAICVRASRRSSSYVADQLGNSPTTLLRDYARIWEDFDPSQRVDAEIQIMRARARVERSVSARASREPRPRRLRRRRRVSAVFQEIRPNPPPIRKNLQRREALCRTRTGDPFLTMEVLYQLS